MEQQEKRNDIVPVEARPVEPAASSLSRLPPIIAKTVNICVNCVQGAGRAVTWPAQRRYRRHYDPRHRFGRHHLVADIGLAVLIIVLLAVNGYLLFGAPEIFPSRVHLAWQVEPTTVRAGDAVTMTLAFRYDGDQPLERVTVALQVAGRLAVTSVTPGRYDAATQTLELGAIAPGAEGEIVVRGTTDAPDGTTLRVRGTVHGSGGSRAERAIADAVVDVRGIAIEVDLTIPPIVPERGVARIGVRYRSQAAVPFDHVVIVPIADAPLTLLRTSAAERPQAIAPGSTATFDMEIRTRDPGSFPITFGVFRAPPDGDREVLGVREERITVQPVPVDFAIGTQGDGPSRIHLGETVEVGANYYGRANAPLPAGLARTFRVAIRGPVVASSRVRAEGTVFRDGVLSWPYRAVPDVGSSAGVAFQLTAPTTIDPAAFAPATTFAYTMVPTLVLAEDPSGAPTAWVEDSAYEVPIAGELRAAAFARYFTPEGDQLGRGPLPPRVGSTTRYWITWDVQSLVRDADRVVARAVLPDGVEWTGRIAATEGTAPQFDPATRTVTWSVGRVERTIGARRPAATASFEVALIPGSALVGRFAPLLGETTVGGGDDLGTALTATVRAVTTDLVLDQRARGKGRVE